MTESEMKLWRSAMETIGRCLDQARHHMNKQEWNFVRMLLQSARDTYNSVKHLKPPPVTPPRGSGPWLGKAGYKPPARPPGKPVNIDALRGSNLRLFCRLDPLFLLQLEDMLMDYLYARYGTPAQNWERSIEKGAGELYWIDVINGRPARTPGEYKQEFLERFTT
jgi:hypothetical protein